MKQKFFLKKRIGMNSIGIAVSLIAVFVGAVMLASAFRRADEELYEERSEHLMDLVWAVDRNIGAMLKHPQEELRINLEEIQEEEQIFLNGGGEERFADFLREQPILKIEGAAMLMVTDGEKPLLCTDCGADCEFVFPDGVSENGPSICVGGGVNYLAVCARSPYSELRYAVLTPLSEFYRRLNGRDISDEYWLVLYDRAHELYLQNDDMQPELRRLSPQEAMKREDGYSILAECEENAMTITREYPLVIEGETAESTIFMAAAPRQMTVNGVFAVGVAYDRDAWDSTEIIHYVAWDVLYAGILLLLGLVILIAILNGSSQHNRRLREETELLKQQKDNAENLLNTTRELAHLQRLELIGTMTSSIAHEFNNMLTPIMGYSIMVMENLPEGCDELYDNLSEIYDASRRAKSLVSRLSALSRKGNASEATLFSPDALLDKVEEMMTPAKPRNVTLEKDYHCPEVCLRANETQITQLLLNLIINAFQAMEQEGGTLTLSTGSENGSVIFKVADTGPGIAPEILSRVFEPFFTTKEMGRGTGLGLAIVRQIADEHRGRITVESELGKGTTFTLVLPENRAEPNA